MASTPGGVPVLTRNSTETHIIDLSADDPDGKPNCNSVFVVGTDLSEDPTRQARVRPRQTQQDRAVRLRLVRAQQIVELLAPGGALPPPASHPMQFISPQAVPRAAGRTTSNNDAQMFES